MEGDYVMGEETRSFVRQHFPEHFLAEMKALARYVAGRKAGQVDVSGLVIDALLRAARHHRQLEDVGSLKAWFRTILVREVMARLQLERYRRTCLLGAQHLERLPQTREPSDTVDREDEKSWAKAYLGRLLAQLPESDQEVICLSRLKGLPDEEVASLLGISKVSLRQRRHRAIKQLQKLARLSPPR